MSRTDTADSIEPGAIEGPRFRGLLAGEDLRGADFVVIGGGVHGAGVAYRLARAGADVLLLEGKTIASGASGGRGKRGVRANRRSDRELPLSAASNEIWPSLADELGAPTGYERVGGIHFFEEAADLAVARAQADLQNRCGIETHVVQGSDLHALEPDVGPNVIGGLFVPADGVVDHTAATVAFAAAARKLGARVREGTRATGFRTSGTRVVAVTTEAGEISVRREVLVVANTGTPALVATLGVTLRTFEVWPQVVVTAVLDRMPARHLIGHLSRMLHAKALPDGRLQITGGWLGEVDPVTGSGVTVPSIVAANLAEAVAVYPALAGVRIEEAFADRVESVCADLLPVIDRVPGTENVIVATGWSGAGFAIAPAVSVSVAEWMMSGRKAGVLEGFGWGRG